MRLLAIVERTFTVAEAPEAFSERLARRVSDGSLRQSRPDGRGMMLWKGIGTKGCEAHFQRFRMLLDVSGYFATEADGKGTTVQLIVAFQAVNVVLATTLVVGGAFLQTLPSPQLKLLGLAWILISAYSLGGTAREARRYLDLYLIPELRPPNLETCENQDSVNGI